MFFKNNVVNQPGNSHILNLKTGVREYKGNCKGPLYARTPVLSSF